MSLETIWVSVKVAVLVAFGVAAFVIGGPLVDKVLNLMEAKEELYNEQIVRLSDGAVSQRIEYSNKLLEQQITELKKEIVDLAAEREQEIVSVGAIVASLQQDLEEQIGEAYKDKEDSSKDFVETIIKKKMPDDSEVPWAWSMYSPNIAGENKWTTGTYPVKLHTKVAIGKNDDRSDAYVETYMTSDVFAADQGKKFPITVDSVEWVEAPPNPKSWMYNIRFSLGFGVSTDIFGAVEASFFSYGRTETDMDWRLLGVGLGVSDDNGFLYVVPAAYNLGQNIEYINNLFLGPFVGIDGDGVIGGVGLQIPF